VLSVLQLQVSGNKHTDSIKRPVCPMIAHEIVSARFPSLLHWECECHSTIEITDVLFKACNPSDGASASCSGSTSLSAGWMNVLNVLNRGSIEGSIDVAIVLTFLTPLHKFLNPFVMFPRPIMVSKIMHAVTTNDKKSMAILSLLRPECPASFSHRCQEISFLRKMKVAAMMASSQTNVIAQQKCNHLHKSLPYC
jgi:hypothetical protein